MFCLQWKYIYCTVSVIPCLVSEKLCKLMFLILADTVNTKASFVLKGQWFYTSFWVKTIKYSSWSPLWTGKNTSAKMFSLAKIIAKRWHSVRIVADSALGSAYAIVVDYTNTVLGSAYAIVVDYTNTVLASLPTPISMALYFLLFKHKN